MASIIRGTDIPFDLKNFPVGAEIKRLDFAQNNNVVLKTHVKSFRADKTLYEGVI